MHEWLQFLHRGAENAKAGPETSSFKRRLIVWKREEELNN